MYSFVVGCCVGIYEDIGIKRKYLFRFIKNKIKKKFQQRQNISLVTAKRHSVFFPSKKVISLISRQSEYTNPHTAKYRCEFFPSKKTIILIMFLHGEFWYFLFAISFFLIWLCQEKFDIWLLRYFFHYSRFAWKFQIFSV